MALPPLCARNVSHVIAAWETDGGDEAVPFDASPTTFRQAFMKYKPGEKVDVESEDGWEYGATVLGPAQSGDADELRIRFADGVVDDWPVADFRPAEVRLHVSPIPT